MEPDEKEEQVEKDQPIEQAEEWAGREIPEDAQQITQAGPTHTNPNSSQEY